MMIMCARVDGAMLDCQRAEMMMILRGDARA